MDETAMRQALDVLRDQLGERLAGDMLKGETTMRQTLMQHMDVDESTADKLVKQLIHTGWVTFRGSGVNEDEGNPINPVVGMGGRATAGAADTWTDDEAVGTPDAARVPAAPFITGAAITGMQTGSSPGAPGAAGAGGVTIGAATAGLAGSENVAAGRTRVGEDGTVTGANVPDVDQNAINSYAADTRPSDPRGYWAIGTIPPPAGDLTTATLGVTPPAATGTMPAASGGMTQSTTGTMPAASGGMTQSTTSDVSPAPAAGVAYTTPDNMPASSPGTASEATDDRWPPTTP